MNWPFFILLFVALERLTELLLAHYNTKRLLKRGATEVGAMHYPLIVAFHGAWLFGLFFLRSEAVVNWWLIDVFTILQALRLWVLATLGSRWTTRILTLPAETLVSNGPYRFFRHPNYLVVAAEIFVLPLAFGFYWYAIIGGLINLLILRLRIKVEERVIGNTV